MDKLIKKMEGVSDEHRKKCRDESTQYGERMFNLGYAKSTERWVKELRESHKPKEIV